SCSPTSFHSKSCTLPSKYGPSSWERSEPRKPSDRFAGDTWRVRRRLGTYVHTESRALGSRYRHVSERMPSTSAGDSTCAYVCSNRSFESFPSRKRGCCPSKYL